MGRFEIAPLSFITTAILKRFLAAGLTSCGLILKKAMDKLFIF